MRSSVLTPIYNHIIQYVRRCLKSLNAQTLREIEPILIDDEINLSSSDLIDKFIKKNSCFKDRDFEKRANKISTTNWSLSLPVSNSFDIICSTATCAQVLKKKSFIKEQRRHHCVCGFSNCFAPRGEN